MGSKFKSLNELQERATQVADDLFRIDLYSREKSGYGRYAKRDPERSRSGRRWSPSPIEGDEMEGLEYTGRSRDRYRPRRLSDDEMSGFVTIAVDQAI